MAGKPTQEMREAVAMVAHGASVREAAETHDLRHSSIYMQLARERERMEKEAREAGKPLMFYPDTYDCARHMVERWRKEAAQRARERKLQGY